MPMDIKAWPFTLVGLLVLVMALGCTNPGSEEPAVNAYGNSVEDIEVYTAYYSEGLVRLALEYGYRLDEDAVRACLAERFADAPDLPSSTTVKVLGWVSSPDDSADALKSVILDSGDTPAEWMQEFAEKVQGGC